MILKIKTKKLLSRNVFKSLLYPNMTKKDMFLVALRTIVWGSLLAYVIYLYTHHVDIVPTKEWSYDATILAITGLIAVMIIIVGIARICFKKPRMTMIFMGIFLILFAFYSGIQDDPAKHIHLRDILATIGTLATLLGFTKICIYDKCKKIEEKQREEQMEIIEV